MNCNNGNILYKTVSEESDKVAKRSIKEELKVKMITFYARQRRVTGLRNSQERTEADPGVGD